MSEPSASAPQDTLLYLLRTAILAELHTGQEKGRCRTDSGFGAGDQRDFSLQFHAEISRAGCPPVVLCSGPACARGMGSASPVPSFSLVGIGAGSAGFVEVPAQ
jgi:hypothetical protein